MRIIVFFHHNPWPMRSGNYRGTLELTDSLIRSGCDVYLASSNRLTPWNAQSIQAIRRLGIKEVFVFKHGPLHRLYEWGRRLFAKVDAKPAWRKGVPLCSPWMRHWFSRRIESVQADAIIVNYAMSDEILDHKSHQHRIQVLQLHDLLSENVELQGQVAREREQFLRTGIAGVYFEQGDRKQMFSSIPEDELAILGSYDLILSASKREVRILTASLGSGTATWCPVVIPSKAMVGKYDGLALFVGSAHIFNQQGMVYFTSRLLPGIRASCPDFSIHVLGDIARAMAPSEGIRYLGYWEQDDFVWQHAAFFICPLLHGTGQPVKIVEAMARGLAVVGFTGLLEESPVQHGVSGFMANNEQEFVDYVCFLWKDRLACGRMGAAARSAVEKLSGDRQPPAEAIGKTAPKSSRARRE